MGLRRPPSYLVFPRLFSFFFRCNSNQRDSNNENNRRDSQNHNYDDCLSWRSLTSQSSALFVRNHHFCTLGGLHDYGVFFEISTDRSQNHQHIRAKSFIWAGGQDWTISTEIFFDLLRGGIKIPQRWCISQSIMNALSLCLSSGALRHTVYILIIAAMIVSLKFFSCSNVSVRTWGSLEQKHQNQFGQYKMQTADCRLGTKRRLQTGYKIPTKNFYYSFGGYVITCHFTTYRASQNRFSAIIICTIVEYSLPVSLS